jgi:hypothetical protein
MLWGKSQSSSLCGPGSYDLPTTVANVPMYAKTSMEIYKNVSVRKVTIEKAKKKPRFHELTSLRLKGLTTIS